MAAKKKRVKKPRNPDALNAIVKCKGGVHKDKRKKRKKRDDLLEHDTH
jgi:hypothetical protein